jgi:hypothetical protein
MSRRYISLGGMIFVAIMAAGFAEQLTAEETLLEGFFITKEIRFDESIGERKPTPQIPKSWQFVGVSNGEKINSNNLWFQDKDGNIYLIQGFNSYGQFIVREGIQKLKAK